MFYLYEGLCFILLLSHYYIIYAQVCKCCSHAFALLTIYYYGNMKAMTVCKTSASAEESFPL